jgi:hypothetical protein
MFFVGDILGHPLRSLSVPNAQPTIGGSVRTIAAT